MMRLIVDPPLAGSLNMAIDQALLESVAESGPGVLRIYRWQPATVSLGYFQNFDTRKTHDASADCPLVRRASGGGAIVHDQEMTYSLTLPAGNQWAERNRDLFDTVHQTLIQGLRELGVQGCEVYRKQERESRSAPFLCFQRRAVGDVTLDREKVIGSAQRRLQDALLQHGSVLLGRSNAAPELPGILDLRSGTRCSMESLIELWPGILAGQMGWEFERGQLSDRELTAAKSIQSSKFESDHWNRKR